MMDILTLNCGSSSLKYQLYRWTSREILANGIVERVTVGGSFIKHTAQGRETVKIEHDCPNHREALSLIIRTLLDPEVGALEDLKQIKAVGHRVVHGGEKFAQSVVITPEALDTFRQLADLAPLHNPPNIMGIEAARELLPEVPHCAIMDTAWHQTMPGRAFMYALPYSWYQSYGVRRYGFHGTSFLYTAKRAAVLLGQDPFQTNLIILHIGNGASANAVKDGVSIDTSMGFTPLEGLVMGTRSGDHDPAIGYYIIDREQLAPRQMEAILNKKSGVFGITEKYTDRRDIELAAEAGDSRSQLAIEVEGYRIRKYIGAYYAALGRVDAVVFTAGVGEMGPIVREKAVAGLEGLGIRLDERRNNLSMTRDAETIISTDDSPVKVFVIPTDEELVMTEDTYALLQGTYDVHTRFTYSFQARGYANQGRQRALEKKLESKPQLQEIIARVPGAC
jgi:acetate kinase